MAADFFSAQEQFNQAGRAFGKNVTAFAAGIASLDSVLNDHFGSFKDNLKDIMQSLTRWTEVFTLSHIALSIQQLVSEIDHTATILTKTYGFVGQQRRDMQRVMATQGAELAQYGITITRSTEATTALVSELRNFSVFSNHQLMRTNALVQEVFGFADEAGARLVGNLKRFAGASEGDIRSFFEDTVTASKDLNVSYRAVGENIANNAHLLTIFNMKLYSIAKCLIYKIYLLNESVVKIMVKPLLFINLQKLKKQKKKHKKQTLIFHL